MPKVKTKRAAAKRFKVTGTPRYSSKSLINTVPPLCKN